MSSDYSENILVPGSEGNILHGEHKNTKAYMEVAKMEISSVQEYISLIEKIKVNYTYQKPGMGPLKLGEERFHGFVK